MKNIFTPSWLFFVTLALLATLLNFLHELGILSSLATVLGLITIFGLSLLVFVLLSKDYSETGPRHRLRLFYSSCRNKVELFFGSMQARIYGRNYKKNLRKITAELHNNGEKSFKEIQSKFRFPEKDLQGYLSDLVWRKWAETIPSLDKDTSTIYRITDRGSRDLANPGSTDHEEL